MDWLFSSTITWAIEAEGEELGSVRFCEFGEFGEEVYPDMVC